MAIARCRCCERRQPVRARGPRRHERSPLYKIIHCVYIHIFDASAIWGATRRVAYRPSSCVPLNAPPGHGGGASLSDAAADARGGVLRDAIAQPCHVPGHARP